MSYAAFGAVPKTVQKTASSTAGTLVAADGTKPSRSGSGILLRAPSGNSATVFVGGSDVTTSNGYGLEAGKELWLPIDDPSKVFVVVATGTQPVHVLYL